MAISQFRVLFVHSERCQICQGQNMKIAITLIIVSLFEIGMGCAETDRFQYRDLMDPPIRWQHDIMLEP